MFFLQKLNNWSSAVWWTLTSPTFQISELVSKSSIFVWPNWSEKRRSTTWVETHFSEFQISDSENCRFTTRSDTNFFGDLKIQRSEILRAASVTWKTMWTNLHWDGFIKNLEREKTLTNVGFILEGFEISTRLECRVVQIYVGQVRIPLVADF